MRDDCAQIAGYRAVLERLVAEPSSPDGGMSVRPADAPLPGNTQAFGALMVIWEAVPRLEAALRLAVAGHPGLRRGGSAGNFLEALAAIPGLAAGLDEDGEGAAARLLERLVRLAQSVRAIDEAERWRPVPARACPYCTCYFLKVLEDTRGQPTGRVGCFGHLPSGEPCRAAWASVADIIPDLARADELAAPDLDG